MFRKVIVAPKAAKKRGRPFTRFVCPIPDCGRGCRTDQGLKAHMTRLHSEKPHQEPEKSILRGYKEGKARAVDQQLREVRARIAENINRLTIELGEIDKAIEVCERHLGEGGED